MPRTGWPMSAMMVRPARMSETTVRTSAIRATGRSRRRSSSRISAAMVMPAKLTPTKYTSKAM